MTELETKKQIRWDNLKRTVAKMLYPHVFEQLDDKREAADSNNIIIKQLENELEDLHDHIKYLEDEILDLKLFELDLSEFETTRNRKINGRYMLLSSWLSNKKELDVVRSWWDANKLLNISEGMSDDELVIELRRAFYEHLDKKDHHVPEKGDVWELPSETIEKKFKVDCEGVATFLHYLYQVVSELYDRPRLKENMYFILCGVNTKDGWNLGNHASLLWKHSDEKFYIIESAVSKNSDYILDSLRQFGVTDYTQNFRYGRIVMMSNGKKNYYKVIL